MDSSSSGTDEECNRRCEQQVVSDISARTLEGVDLERLFREATDAVATALDADSCTVLELVPDADQFVHRSANERNDGSDERETIPVDRDSQAGYTLIDGGPVIVDDVRSDDRITELGPNLDRKAKSGISAIIGTADEPWGVLRVHATTVREFGEANATFVQNVANVLALAVERDHRYDDPAPLETELERYATVVETAHDGIYMLDEDRNFELVNEAFAELTQFSRDELRGRHASVVFEDEFASMEASQREAAAGSTTPPFEETIEAGSDENGTRTIENRFSILSAEGGETKLVGLVRDITERKQLENKLEEILGRIDDAVCAFDEEFRYTHVNERAEELLQRSESELLGERLWEAFPASASDEIVRESFQTAMESQEPTNYVHYYEPADVWLEVTIYPSETGASVYFRDVTERKEYERQLEESNERLEQFAYAASHDLQEPLRMISSYLRLIEDRYGDELDEDGQEFIDYAVDGAERMREMIDGLLEFSRIETRGKSLEPIDLDDVLADVERDLRVQIEETDAEIVSEPLPRVEGDGNQLRQVFQNLLSNAIAYAGDEPPRIEISTHRAGEKWVVSVSDEGIGIDPDDVDRIFGVFQRLHTVEERSGSGIGLALCERIIKRHGGRIWVDSVPGSGTTFSFTLPAAEDPTEPADG